MRSFPIPSNEAARQAALDQTCGLTEGGDPRLDALADEVRGLTGCPTALVSLVDTDRQFFSGRAGFPQRETPRDYSICAHVILSDEDLVIPDTHASPRFRNHPVVVNPPHVRFYAGTPIVLSSGYRAGSLCALDWAPRAAPSPEVMEGMRALARRAAAVLEGPAAPVRPPEPPQPAPAPAAAEASGQTDFMKLINHELRTPLTVILGYARILETRIEKDPEAEILAAVSRAGESLRAILEGIMNYSDLATGERRMQEVEFDLTAQVGEIVRSARMAAADKGKSIDFEGPQASIQVSADRHMIDVAATALVMNAISHGGRDVRVSLVTAAEGHLCLAVRDDGETDGAELDGLIEAFRVGGEIKNRKALGGIGLGLTTTRRIVELHAGELTLTREDGWTRAEIWLPAWRIVERAAA